MNIHYDSFLRRKHFTIIVVVEYGAMFWHKVCGICVKVELFYDIYLRYTHIGTTNNTILHHNNSDE